MWIPQGTFRAPQSWIVWAAGTASGSLTTWTVGWTTAIGQTAITANSADTNTVLASTGALNPAVAATVTWNYRAHATIRSPGSSGTIFGTHEVQMSNNATGSGTNAIIGLGGVAAGVTLDCTQGAYWAIDITNNVTTNSVQLLEMVILACD
jgi:hypothetical protein